MSPFSDTLKKILDYAAKVQAVTAIVAPGFNGVVGVGVYVAKALADQWNAAHPEQPVVLPDDAGLIAALAATSTRVVDTGTTFLDA